MDQQKVEILFSLTSERERNAGKHSSGTTNVVSQTARNSHLGTQASGGREKTVREM